jgi:phosphoserine phosphatase
MNILASRVARELSIRNAYSNIPIFDEKEAIIPGGIPVVEPLKKDRVVRRIMRILGVDQKDTIYVGDSIWYLTAFKEVNIPILFLDNE